MKRNKKNLYSRNWGKYGHAPQGETERYIRKGVGRVTTKLVGMYLNRNPPAQPPPPPPAAPRFTFNRILVLTLLILILSLLMFEISTLFYGQPLFVVGLITDITVLTVLAFIMLVLFIRTTTTPLPKPVQNYKYPKPIVLAKPLPYADPFDFGLNKPPNERKKLAAIAESHEKKKSPVSPNKKREDAAPPRAHSPGWNYNGL